MDQDHYFSAEEIVEATGVLPEIPGTSRGFEMWAERNGIPKRVREARGGGWEYLASSLPKRVQAKLRGHVVAEQREAAQIEERETIPYSPEQLLLGLEQAIEEEREQIAAEGGAATAFKLPKVAVERMEARTEAVWAFLEWHKNNEEALSPSRVRFCEMWAARSIPTVSPKTYAALPEFHPASLRRWQEQVKSEGLGRLAGNYGRRGEPDLINGQTKVRDTIFQHLVLEPRASVANLYRFLEAKMADEADIELPSKRSVERYIVTWKALNPDLWLAMSDPQGFRGKIQAAFGSYSANVKRPNQLWEIDSTATDVHTDDGRLTIIVLIDVYTRRVMVLVSQTSKSTAIATLLRRAFLEWGIPETIKTDNGKDYVSRLIKRIIRDLSIEHKLCDPFCPWQKPHVERFNRTLQHGLVEQYPTFGGHNVKDAMTQRERERLVERLTVKVKAHKGEDQGPVDLWAGTTQESLQTFYSTCVDIYHHEPHEGLGGKTPFQVMAEWDGKVRKVRDERYLDVLLAEAPGDGLRIVQKKGVKVDGGYYIAPELGEFVGHQVAVFWDPEDIGRINVRSHTGDFICWAVCPERGDLGISQQEVAAKATAIQKAAIKAKLAEIKASGKLTKADVIETIIEYKTGRNSKLTPFPKAEVEYVSPGLEQAAEAVAAANAVDAPKTPEQDAADKAATEAAMGDQGPLEEPQDRYRRCFIARHREEPVSEEDLAWMAGFEQLSWGRGLKEALELAAEQGQL
jgi:transposase InsO family protein